MFWGGKKNQLWLRDGDIWVLALAPYDLGHDTLLALIVPFLREENIHQMISGVTLSVKLPLHIPSGPHRDKTLTSVCNGRKGEGEICFYNLSVIKAFGYYMLLNDYNMPVAIPSNLWMRSACQFLHEVGSIIPIL